MWYLLTNCLSVCVAAGWMDHSLTCIHTIVLKSDDGSEGLHHNILSSSYCENYCYPTFHLLI